ncbi:MAG TPA: CPBP family intramembrane glutamic endopeptidase, partial [Prevotella sp.]
MNKQTNAVTDILLFLVVFFLIQLATTLIADAISMMMSGFDTQLILQKLAHGQMALDGKFLAFSSVLASLITIVLFARLKWSPYSNQYLRSKPWVVLVWVVLLALGTIIPSQWLQEQLNLKMPTSMEQMFFAIMKEPWGYAAIGILAPIAEEMVFRGAVLRRLLSLFNSKRPWLPIVLSAVVFGAFHLNWAQFTHATLIGI